MFGYLMKTRGYRVDLNSFMTEVPIIKRSKSMDWPLYDKDFRHERVKSTDF